jgi:hypothetical protein
MSGGLAPTSVSRRAYSKKRYLHAYTAGDLKELKMFQMLEY